MGVAKLYLLGVYRLNLDPHPRVQSAGPEGPGRLHSGVGIEVEPINTKQIGLGHLNQVLWNCTQIKGEVVGEVPPLKGGVIIHVYVYIYIYLFCFSFVFLFLHIHRYRCGTHSYIPRLIYDGI